MDVPDRIFQVIVRVNSNRGVGSGIANDEVYRSRTRCIFNWVIEAGENPASSNYDGETRIIAFGGAQQVLTIERSQDDPVATGIVGSHTVCLVAPAMWRTDVAVVVPL